MTILIAGLLIAAIIVIVVVQTISRHRRLVKRQAEGQTVVPASTWIVFGASAAFLIFAVFILPALLRK